MWGYVIKIGKPRQPNNYHSSNKSNIITVWHSDGETRAILPYCWFEHHHLSLVMGLLVWIWQWAELSVPVWRVTASALTLVAKSDQRRPVSKSKPDTHSQSCYTRLDWTQGVYCNQLCVWLLVMSLGTSHGLSLAYTWYSGYREWWMNKIFKILFIMLQIIVMRNPLISFYELVWRWLRQDRELLGVFYIGNVPC